MCMLTGDGILVLAGLLEVGRRVDGCDVPTPGPQRDSEVAPAACEKRPAGQGTQLLAVDAPGAVPYLPASQLTQAES